MKALNLRLWEPVFSDDRYNDEPINEPVFSDDFEEEESLEESEEQSIEEILDQLDCEQENHQGTLTAIQNSYPFSDVLSETTDWGMDEFGNDLSEFDFDV